MPIMHYDAIEISFEQSKSNGDILSAQWAYMVNEIETLTGSRFKKWQLAKVSKKNGKLVPTRYIKKVLEEDECKIIIKAPCPKGTDIDQKQPYPSYSDLWNCVPCETYGGISFFPGHPESWNHYHLLIYLIRNFLSEVGLEYYLVNVEIALDFKDKKSRRKFGVRLLPKGFRASSNNRYSTPVFHALNDDSPNTTAKGGNSHGDAEYWGSRRNCQQWLSYSKSVKKGSEYHRIEYKIRRDKLKRLGITDPLVLLKPIERQNILEMNIGGFYRLDKQKLEKIMDQEGQELFIKTTNKDTVVSTYKALREGWRLNKKDAFELLKKVKCPEPINYMSEFKYVDYYLGHIHKDNQETV